MNMTEEIKSKGLKMIDVFSDELAEALFHFVGKEERYIHFCKCCENSDLSMAEYVDKYCKSEFEEYCINKGYYTL